MRASILLLAFSLVSAYGDEPSGTATPPATLSGGQSNGVIAATPTATPTPSATPSTEAPTVATKPSPEPGSAAGPAPMEPSPTAMPPGPAEAFSSDNGNKSKFDAVLFGGQHPTYDAEERAGIAITEAWRKKSYESMRSQAGVDGSVQFEYGTSYPSIVCAILQVTDVELEPGEVVTALKVGDTTRWNVESASSGSGADQVQHLIIKPRDYGLSTSMIVTTDRRTYHLVLVSDQAEFMHNVRFVYPHSAPQSVLSDATPAMSPATAPQKVADTPPPQRSRHKPDGKQVSYEDETGPDDSYAITGHADWKPVHAYNKNGKTYIEMPRSMRHKEAPVLFEETKKGWFHHEKVLVNYRVKGNWYVVDKVIDKGTLVSGVGSGQVKVNIDHKEAPQKQEVRQ